jgi:hypothetical protein
MNQKKKARDFLLFHIMYVLRRSFYLDSSLKKGD